ncbi:hypothetical protein [Halosimplex amylolyticum]|uniref:hypothetical protein n=1 Tax=Halosimplex amylolyticum TaxID=3396616 RepID=UPI003F569E8F
MTASERPYKKAEEERERGNLVEAGEWYTSAAFKKAASMPLYPSSGGELKHFLEAATCYRIAGRMNRCVNRCRTGILRAEEMADRALSAPTPDRDIHHADRGGWYEAVGMFRLVGNVGGVEDAYDNAFSIYEEAGDPRSHRAEPPKTTLYTWFYTLEHAATGDSTTMEFRKQQTYIEFAEYVREKIPQYLQTLEETGEWGNEGASDGEYGSRDGSN